MKRAERYARIWREVCNRANPIRVRGEGVRMLVHRAGKLAAIVREVDGRFRGPIMVWRMARRLAELYGADARTVFELRDVRATEPRRGYRTIRAHTRAVRAAVVLLPSKPAEAEADS